MKNEKELMQDLKLVYRAISNEVAKVELDKLKEKKVEGAPPLS